MTEKITVLRAYAVDETGREIRPDDPDQLLIKAFPELKVKLMAREIRARLKANGLTVAKVAP